MGSYLQMGHQTENLVGETDLDNFDGIVLSPLNRLPDELKIDIPTYRKVKNFDIVLDPQLYYPKTPKNKIREHPYFPSDFDSSDHSSLKWWEQINNNLMDYAIELGVNTVVSPVIDPSKCSIDYYQNVFDVFNHLYSKKQSTVSKIWAALIIDINDIVDDNFLMELASFFGMFNSDGFYIIFKSDIEPRREYSEEKQIKAMLKFINELKILNKEIMISFSSSDMILFKAAGASHCGTGKFFNLRRFTKSRFEEPSGGGGQLPYFFEHNLLAFLREADILRIKDGKYSHYLLGNTSNNYWAKKIFKQFDAQSGKAWVGDGWRQYLSWFSKTEQSLQSDKVKETVDQWLKTAEECWLNIEEEKIFMDEVRNNGKWLRPWRQALSSLT